MKSLKILFSIIITFSVFALISCGDSGNKPGADTETGSISSSSSSPSGLITTAIKDVADGDYETVVDLYVKKGGEALNKDDRAKLMALLPNAKAQFDKKGGIKDINVIEEKIADDGNSATVKYKIIFANGKNGGSEKVHFVKVDGDWKVRIN